MPSTTLRKTLRTRGHRQLIAILAAARKQAGLTQRDLAAKLRRPHSFVGRLEAGERRIDVIEFIEIASALTQTPDSYSPSYSPEKPLRDGRQGEYCMSIRRNSPLPLLPANENLLLE